jgi:hypothetical protein
MEEIGRLLNTIGLFSPVIYAAATYGLFSWLDENASDEAKAALIRVMRVRVADGRNFASVLLELFDGLYTSPLLSGSAFLRSTLFTFLVSGLFILQLNYFVPLADRIRSGDIVAYLLGISLVINIGTDYLSLFAIREWLKLGGTKVVPALLIGTVVGVLILIMGNAVRAASLALTFKFEPLPEAWNAKYFASVILQLFQSYAFLSLPAIAVFIWLPLLAIGIAVFRATNFLFWLSGRTQWLLRDGGSHPLRALGLVASIIVFAVSTGWGLVLSRSF